MDTKIKELLQELGEAINDSVTQSPRVAEVLDFLRDSGYDVNLLLEAKIAIEEKSAKNSDDIFTDADREFLRRLRIRV